MRSVMAWEIATDESVAEMLPALREFVDAVNDRDLDVMQAALQHTPPITLAILAAGWIGDLLDQLDAVTEEASLLDGRYYVAQVDVARYKKAAAKAVEERSEALRRITKLQGDLFIKRETEKE